MIRAEHKVTRDRNKEPDVTQKMKSWLIQASQALLLEPSWGSLPPARGGGQAEPPPEELPHCQQALPAPVPPWARGPFERETWA